jgi:hypothetical protein
MCSIGFIRWFLLFSAFAYGIGGELRFCVFNSDRRVSLP